MNDTLKFAVVAATVSLLLFCFSIYHVKFAVMEPRMSDFADFHVDFVQPVTSPSAEALTKSIRADLSPYKSFFFENMKLYGMRRSRNGLWTALFAGESGSVIALNPGESHDGVTIVSADGGSCRVRYGSVERNFVL